MANRCSARLRWLNRGMVWERLRWLNPQGTRGGFWVGAMLMLAVKPQRVHCKLDELLNSLVVISWHTPWKCVRVLVGTTSIRLSKDNHDSWVTCTSSAEYKTIITAVLTVMSGMDPHMISGNIGMGNCYVLVGLCQSGFYYVVGRSR
jgi:hypothetical protein